MTGGPDRFSYFITKKSQLQICQPQKITTFFLTYPKIPLFFFLNPKNSRRLSKKSLLVKISDPKKSLGPPLSLKYVTGPRGICCRVLDTNHENRYSLVLIQRQAGELL